MMKNILQCIQVVLESNYSFLLISALLYLFLTFFKSCVIEIQIRKLNLIYRNVITFAGQILVACGVYSAMRSIDIFYCDRITSFVFNLLSCASFSLSIIFSYSIVNIPDEGLGNILLFVGYIISFTCAFASNIHSFLIVPYVFGSHATSFGLAIKILNKVRYQFDCFVKREK